MRSLIRLLILGWLAVAVLGIVLPTLMGALLVVPMTIARAAGGVLEAPVRMVGMTGGHTSIGVLPMLVLLSVIVLAFLIAIRAMRARRNDRTGYEPETAGDEARMMREINQSLTRLEDRIETLETILFESGAQASSSRDGGRRTQSGTERDGL